MVRSLVRRLAIIPLALVLVNFAAFAYAHIALQVQRAQNPFGSAVEGAPPIFALYGGYVRRAVTHLDLGQMPSGTSEAVGGALARAAGASLGLLAIAFAISVAAGLTLGLAAVRTDPTRVSGWLAPLASAGLALPSFFIGTLFIVAAVAYLLHAGPDAALPLPLAGFGWGLPLLLPVTALVVRPTAQIAQVTARLLSAELDRPYVVAARAVGLTWRRIRWKQALRNALLPLVLTVAGSFRLLIGELILVEWLFSWPGLGRLLALTLIPPRIALTGGPGDQSIYFLHPPLLAALLTVFALLFLLADTAGSLAARLADPRVDTAGGGLLK
jgi:ABC-type dipeptide/oligopeptide/nickel transport system permease component